MVDVRILHRKVIHNHKITHKQTEDPFSEILRLYLGCFFYSPFFLQIVLEKSLTECALDDIMASVMVPGTGSFRGL